MSRKHTSINKSTDLLIFLSGNMSANLPLNTKEWSSSFNIFVFHFLFFRLLGMSFYTWTTYSLALLNYSDQFLNKLFPRKIMSPLLYRGHNSVLCAYVEECRRMGQIFLLKNHIMWPFWVNTAHINLKYQFGVKC